MDRSLWTSPIFADVVPPFPCPRCSRGHLRLNKADLNVRRPAYVTFEDFEEGGDKNVCRFTMFLCCSNAACGEVVAVAGDVESGQVATEFDYEEVDFLIPYTMFPAPPIITIPKKTPKPVAEEIQRSFRLYWESYGVCANRLRTSVERLMDHFGIAKTHIAKDIKKPTKPGRRLNLDLSARIDKFAKKVGTLQHSDLLHALRIVGNLGTHGGSVSRNVILDAYSIYEKALAD